MKRMQKMKYFLSGILCTLMLLVLTEPALGALVGKTIQVYTGVNVYVDDVKIEPQDEHGNPVEVFSYNGTTYLPVRALSKAFGKPIQWEGKTLSVYVGKHSSDKPAVWLENLDYFDSSDYPLETKKDMKDNLGNTYEHALRCHAATEQYTVYKLNGQYSAISGTFFKTYETRSLEISSTMKIYGDGELLYSASVTSGIDPIEFYVDLTGVLELKIYCNNFYTYGRYENCAGIGDCGLWA